MTPHHVQHAPVTRSQEGDAETSPGQAQEK